MRVLELIAPAFLVITLAGFSTRVGSAQTLDLECTQLSYVPDDGTPLAAGLEVLASKKIDPSQVESACRSALRADPANPTFMFHLGRALSLGNKRLEAIKYYLDAAGRGHAGAEGEDMSDPETALACVQVFALGSGPGAANPSEGGYFVVRGMLAKSVTHAARLIAERGLLEKGGPLLVRFIAQVASRFGTVVTQKLAAQAIPVIGAVGGAAVNYAFIEHFQEVARGHFAVRRLERVYGKDPVRQEYERFAARG